MCQAVTVNGEYTGQVQQLADILGVHPDDLVWHDRHPESIGGSYKFCLCPIDIEGTAEKFGLACERNDWGDATLTGNPILQ